MAEATPETGPPQGSRPVPDPTVLSVDLIERETGHLRELVEQKVECAEENTAERFARIDAAMRTAEQQRIEQKQDTRDAVDAALTAQKEAVAKTEASTVKQIEEIKGTIATSVDGLRREFGDLKERVGAVEQQRVGAREQQVEVREHSQGTNASTVIGIAVFSAFIGLGGLITTIVVLASQ